jgi:DNA-binding CsgD family transcriptional regulator
MANRAREVTTADVGRLLRDYRRGHFQLVAERIDAFDQQRIHVSARLRLLRARIYIKSDVPAAIAYLAKHIKGVEGPTQAEATMLMAVVHARANEDRLAESMFAKAALLIDGLRNRGLAEELRYHVAFFRWTQKRLNEAQNEAFALRSARSSDVRIRAKILEGLVLASQQRYREQALTCLEAHELARGNDDVELLAYTTMNLAVLARELAMPQLRDAVRGSVESVPWTEELRELQFKSLKATAWCCALDGDYFNTFRLLKAASKAAPTDYWRVMAALDRSYLARALSEPRWSQQELLDAHELAQTLNWGSVTREEHVALALLAELFADLDVSIALAYLARFRQLGKVGSRTLSSAYDRRLEAIADYSTGVVHARLHDEDDAKHSFQAAWEVFHSAHYEWRAGRTARELYELTGKRVWLERAQAKLAAYPNSWLSKGIRTTLVPEPLSRLTPAQRRVFDLLVAGASTDDIVEKYGRSIFTVRNHIKAILEAFDVSSRPALVAEAARLGLTRKAPA